MDEIRSRLPRHCHRSARSVLLSQILARATFVAAWCLRMTALRPVIVVRSSVQNPATFACDKRLFQGLAAPLLCGRSGSNRIPLPTHAQRLLVLFWHRVEPAAAAPIDARTDARKFGRIGQLSNVLRLCRASWGRCRLLDTRSHDDHWTKWRHPQTPYNTVSSYDCTVR